LSARRIYERVRKRGKRIRRRLEGKGRKCVVRRRMDAEEQDQRKKRWWIFPVPGPPAGVRRMIIDGSRSYILAQVLPKAGKE